MNPNFTRPAIALMLIGCLAVLGCRISHTTDDLMEMKTVSGVCPICGSMVKATTIEDEGSFDGYGEDGKWTFGTRLCKTCPRCQADLLSKIIGDGRYPDRIEWKVIGTNHVAYLQSLSNK